ncbi:putative ATP-dependent DNA helicase HFM1 [Varanus komodoensis]|nr:putative ATP-dependent DNA helicase HFM1 [Varanus komodoensis]
MPFDGSGLFNVKMDSKLKKIHESRMMARRMELQSQPRQGRHDLTPRPVVAETDCLVNLITLAKHNDTVAEILVTIILTNFEQLQTKRTSPDSHYVTLIIGDNDNQVVFKQKIMDSTLLKTGNWTKKVEVRRAVKSDELSINLISSEYVGLDIHQQYKAIYLEPKAFGDQISTYGKLQGKCLSDSYQSLLAESPAASFKEITSSQKSIKHGNRKCNHHCKNKEMCGHDCCKIGVSKKSDIKEESVFSSYLVDLRNRNVVSSVPPVKRLKMQMLNKTQKVNLKQFGYAPKSFLPRLQRSRCVQHSECTSLLEENDLGVHEKFPLESEGVINACVQNSGNSKTCDQTMQRKPSDALLKSFSIFKEKSDICLQKSNSLSLTPPLNVKPFAEYGNKNKCKEIEENNRIGRTRDLFKKIGDMKGAFHAKMGMIKDQNGRDLTEAEEIKKRWQDYTEELYEKELNIPDNHDGVVTDLKPDILECEVK